ncbi:LOW QUALITY PROTEIN: hypothetical protein HID58_073252, partial [Brassica napus]
IHLEEETVDYSSPTLLRSLPQVLVKNLSPHHTYVLMLLERTANVHGDVGRRDHLHLGDPPVDDRQVEFSDHAERDRAAAGLAVVHLALDEDRLDASLSESLGGGSSCRASADDGDAEAAVGELGTGS